MAVICFVEIQVAQIILIYDQVHFIEHNWMKFLFI